MATRECSFCGNESHENDHVESTESHAVICVDCIERAANKMQAPNPPCLIGWDTLTDKDISVIIKAIRIWRKEGFDAAKDGICVVRADGSRHCDGCILNKVKLEGSDSDVCLMIIKRHITIDEFEELIQFEVEGRNKGYGR